MALFRGHPDELVFGLESLTKCIESGYNHAAEMSDEPAESIARGLECLV
jgi:hypothetical protein